MAELQQPATEEHVRPLSEFEPHEMRITQGGKIRTWVDYALKYFEVSRFVIMRIHNRDLLVHRRMKKMP